MADTFFDIYSIVHAGVGALGAISEVPFPAFLVGTVGFEAVENSIKETRWLKSIWPDISPDTIENHVGDVISSSTGYWLAKRSVSDNPILISLFIGAAAYIWADRLQRG